MTNNALLNEVIMGRVQEPEALFLLEQAWHRDLSDNISSGIVRR